MVPLAQVPIGVYQTRSCRKSRRTVQVAASRGARFSKFRSPGCAQATTTWSPAVRSGYVFRLPKFKSPGCVQAATTWSPAQRSGHVFPKFKSPGCVQAAATWSPAQRSGHVFSKFKVLAASRQARLDVQAVQRQQRQQQQRQRRQRRQRPHSHSVLASWGAELKGEGRKWNW